MKIDNIKINLINPKNGLIGFSSIVLDSGFVVNGIAIHEKLNGTGYRLTYPTRKLDNQTFNICHPINKQVSKAIETAIFLELKNVLNKGCSDVGYDSP